MEQSSERKAFKATIMKVAGGIVLWQMSILLFNTMLSVILYSMDGVEPSVKTGITLFCLAGFQIFAMLPLVGKLSGVSPLSCWMGRLDTCTLGLSFPVMFTAGAIGAFIIDMGIINLLSFLGLPPAIDTVMDFTGPLSGTIMLTVYAVLLAPLMEEVLLRGLLLRALAPYGKGFAIVLTALLFTGIHANFAQFVSPFLFGLVLAYVTLETGSIKVAFILHALNNAVATGWSMVFPYSATIALVGKIATYAVLGLIGMVILIKKRHRIYAVLHTRQEGFIPIEHRAKTVLCNPFILLFLAYVIMMLVSSVRMA